MTDVNRIDCIRRCRSRLPPKSWGSAWQLYGHTAFRVWSSHTLYHSSAAVQVHFQALGVSISCANMPPKLPILVSSAVASILLAHYTPAYTPGSRLRTFFLIAFTEFIAWATWRVVIYPNFFSPLRDLPEPPGASWWNGHAFTIMAQPSGHPMREWIDTIPNDGSTFEGLL